jgi:hemerythrin
MDLVDLFPLVNLNVLIAQDFLYAEKDDIPQVSRTVVNYIEYHYINARETRWENYEWAIP